MALYLTLSLASVFLTFVIAMFFEIRLMYSLSSIRVILHISAPYDSTAITLLLKIFSFVLVLFLVDFQNCLTAMNATLTKVSLLLMISWAPPCLDNTHHSYAYETINVF